MKSILSIADSFFVLNYILINDDKVILLTNKHLLDSREVQFTLSSYSFTIKAKPTQHTECVLGIWIILLFISFNKKFLKYVKH